MGAKVTKNFKSLFRVEKTKTWQKLSVASGWWARPEDHLQVSARCGDPAAIRTQRREVGMVNRGARFAERAGVEDVRVIGWEYSPRQGSAEIVADLCHPEKPVPHDSQRGKVFLTATLAPAAAPRKLPGASGRH